MKRLVRFLILFASMFLVSILIQGISGGFENSIYDSLQSSAEGKLRTPITIVGIDDASFTQLERRWPWPREWLASAIDKLKSMGAAAIGIDILLTDKGFTDQEDAALAKSIKAAGNVVLISHFRQTPQGPVEDPPRPEFSSDAPSGFSALVPDTDGVTRQANYLEVLGADNNILPSFAYQMFAQAKLPVVGKDDPVNDIDSLDARLGRRYIDYRVQGTKPFDNISFGQLLNGNVDPNLVKGRAVFIGAMYPESKDQFASPFSSSRPLYGIEIHAHALASLLQGSFPAFLDAKFSILGILAISALLAALLTFLGFIPSIIAIVVFVAADIGAFMAVWNAQSLFLPVIHWFVPMIVSIPLLMGLHFFLENRERRKLKQYFSRMVSPDVLDHVISLKDAPSLGGERRMVTILFSDIVGFTSMSEQSTPEAVVEILNRYFTSMVDIIFANKGTINKFIGDAIMAIYGAPVKSDEDEYRAVKTALDMRDALQKFNVLQRERGEPEIHIGIGLNTGPVVVGNIGSEKLMEYTVIGDAVNLSSRLESLTRKLDTDIVISDSVYQRVKDKIRVSTPEPVLVKGKEKPVVIHVVEGWIEGANI